MGLHSGAANPLAPDSSVKEPRLGGLGHRRVHGLLTSLLVLFLTFVSAPLFAQQQGTVTRNVNLRPSPTTALQEIRLLTPPEGFTLLEPDPSGGYYHVRTTQNEEGWVWGRNISLGSAVAPMVAPLAPSGEFAFHLSTCPPVGKFKDSATGTLRKYSATSDPGLRNMAKRHVPPAGTPTALELSDLEALQTATNAKVGNAATTKAKFEPTRDALKNLGPDSISEGDRVQIAAFVIDAKGEGNESVNCAGADGKDIHISLGNKTTTEWHGIVAEMIPQIPKEAGWDTATLKRLVKTPKPQVLVIGGLTYDNEHMVNKNSAHPNGTQPKRMSLWEIHPITEFLVCDAASCDPTKKSEWISLGTWKSRHPQ